MDWLTQNRRWLVALVVLVAASVGVTVTVTDDDGDGRPDSVSVSKKQPTTVQLDGPARADGDPQPDTVRAPASEAQVVAQADAQVEDENLKDDPALSTPVYNQSGRTILQQTTGDDAVPDVTTLASFSQPGCETRAVGNFSSRNGLRPGIIVLHYTVSPNRPGVSDVQAIVVYFNNPRSQASSNYVIDNEGHCAYIVSELNKAWTQGNMNPASACSFEVINTGHESTYIGPKGGPGIKKLGRVVADCAKRWGIPLRIGATSGCSVTRTGIVDHNSLACGNFHTDITPFSVSPVVAAAIASRKPPCNKKCQARKAQRKVIAKRKHRHARTHARYERHNCKGPMHKVKLKELRRKRCQHLKRKGHAQHKGITRARHRLHSI